MELAQADGDAPGESVVPVGPDRKLSRENKSKKAVLLDGRTVWSWPKSEVPAEPDRKLIPSAPKGWLFFVFFVPHPKPVLIHLTTTRKARSQRPPLAPARGGAPDTCSWGCRTKRSGRHWHLLVGVLLTPAHGGAESRCLPCVDPPCLPGRRSWEVAHWAARS